MQEREQKLQTTLIAKIDRFMRGDTDGFALSLMNECQRLSEAAYGTAFLHTIGCVCAFTRLPALLILICEASMSSAIVLVHASSCSQS